MAKGPDEMPLVTVKTKYQVTLPTSVRRQAKLAVGDILEAKVEGTKITLTPKTLVDREIALALEEVRKGRVVGPFHSAKALVADLQRRVAREKRKKRPKPA
jgi:AbrB family looped-hinge helix DNA binding protein